MTKFHVNRKQLAKKKLREESLPQFDINRLPRYNLVTRKIF